jgi:hypothetical protein
LHSENGGCNVDVRCNTNLFCAMNSRSNGLKKIQHTEITYALYVHMLLS